MNKKLTVLLVSTAVLATMVTAAACAAKKASTKKAAAPDTVRKTTATESAADLNDDGQNPVMNFIGNYYGGRACITVETKDADSALINVVWGDSYNTKAVWTMEGILNEEETSVSYDNGIKKMITLNEDGEVISEEIIYSSCKGVFVFSYDGITWDDFNEHIADGMVFRFGTSVEEVCTTLPIEETNETSSNEPEELPAEVTEPAPKTAGEISGEYISGRANVTVDAADPSNVMVKVVWSESADTKVIWRISGEYNEETESIRYANGVKKVLTYAEDGEAVLEEVCYTDGSGVIVFSYDGFTWDDFTENIAENMVFIKEA